MSWAAHELESLILHRHTKSVARISYMAILVGALMPDFLKLPVYGLHIGGRELIKAPEPWAYHRGWPGMGPTHSLMFGLVVATLVYLVTRSKPWSIGLLIGLWSHALTDTFDSVGTMLFFPFSTQLYGLGMWEYASQEGRYGDAGAYFSSLGVVWDLFWLVMLLLLARRSLGNRAFHEEIEPSDPTFGWLRRRFGAPDLLLRVIFRAYIVYGAARIFGWFLWARFVNPNRGEQVVDFTWGGPAWVDDPPDFQTAGTWGGFVLTTLVGATGVAVCGYVAWRFVMRLPAESRPESVPVAPRPEPASEVLSD